MDTKAAASPESTEEGSSAPGSEDSGGMDLNKALQIVTKHYSRRNAQFTLPLTEWTLA
jgi:hypothetical protein